MNWQKWSIAVNSQYFQVPSILLYLVYLNFLLWKIATMQKEQGECNKTVYSLSSSNQHTADPVFICTPFYGIIFKPSFHL